MSKKHENLKHSDEEEMEQTEPQPQAKAGGEESAPRQEPQQEPRQGSQQKHSSAPKQPSELEKAQAAAEDYKRKWYAVSAEYDNYRKRNATAVSQAFADGKAEAVLKLLPVADTFGYAYDGASDEKTKAGIDKIIKNFNNILLSMGIEEIPLAAGQPFDENVAEAIMNFPCEEGEQPNQIKQILKKGYKQGEKVIRFAQVTVTV